MAKRYRTQCESKVYLNDVRTHEIARYFVTLFNKAMIGHFGGGDRIQMLPVWHLQFLADVRGNQIVDYVNVEPRWTSGHFVKFTNNSSYRNRSVAEKWMNVLMAFSHYTFHVSNGQLMVTDLQGWLPSTDDGPITLTDPAINSQSHRSFFNITNVGANGISRFWTAQHPECNDMCLGLGLGLRPGE